MIVNRKALYCLVPIAGLALALGGCAQRAAPETTATRVIRPGDQQLTAPVVPRTIAAVNEPSPTAASAAQPAATVAANTAVASASSTQPAANPAAQPAESSASESTGTEFAALRGRVTVAGSVPSLPPLKAAGDPSVSVQDKICVAKAIPDESVVVGPDGGLANVFVFAKRLPSGMQPPPPPTEPVVLDQQGCRFVPQAMVLRVGQPLLMKNSDPVSHNIRTLSLATPINVTLSTNLPEGIEFTYERPERMPVGTKCDIHAWMLSWHLPVDHPYAAVTAPDGSFEIADLPAGDWEFVIWHGRAGYVEKSYKFQAAKGQVVRRDFSVPPAKLSQ